MSGIKEKLASFVDTVADKLNITSNAIEDLIKENKQYIKAEKELSDEAEEGIQALKQYAMSESPSLKTAVTALADAYENMERSRMEKTEKLELQFIKPLEELLIGFEKRKEELKEAKKARKDFDKVKKKLEKEKSKPGEKQKPEKIKDLEVEYEEKERVCNKEDSEAKLATEEFNKKKLQTLKDIINSIVLIQEDFHEAAVDDFREVKTKADQIDVNGEAKIDESEGAQKEVSEEEQPEKESP